MLTVKNAFEKFRHADVFLVQIFVTVKWGRFKGKCDRPRYLDTLLKYYTDQGVYNTC